MKADKTELFTLTPVPRAVLALVIPTVISQLITVVYNMAYTFFIGQLGDSNQVAAASLALPLFLLTTGMANLFGIGGASLISRCGYRPEHLRFLLSVFVLDNHHRSSSHSAKRSAVPSRPC